MIEVIETHCNKPVLKKLSLINAQIACIESSFSHLPYVAESIKYHSGLKRKLKNLLIVNLN